MDYVVKKLLILSLLLSNLVFGGFDAALKKQKFLTPDEAFQTTATLKNDVISTKITMADKIHVYEDSLHFRIVSPKIVALEIKKPKAHEVDGDKVYEKELIINIPTKEIDAKVSGKYTLEVEYQGCSDAGICYQPIKKTFTFQGKKLGTFEKMSTVIKEGNPKKIVDFFLNENPIFVILIFFLLGILISLTPCVFPMIPILSSIILAQEGKDEKHKTNPFLISLVYVFSMAVTYAIVGIVAGLSGIDVGAALQNPWVLSIFALIFIALAFSLFGYYEIGLPASWQSKLTKASDEAQGKGGIIGTAIMGFFSALIVGPCVTPPLAGAVLFITVTGNALLGGLALFAMGMGMGLPLLLLGLGAGKFMPRPGGWMTVISQIFGVTMLAVAILLLGRFLPPSVTLFLWALLFIGVALFMGVFNPSTSTKGAQKLFQLLAMIFLLYGASLFVGVLTGATSVLHPFEKFTSSTKTTEIKKEDKNTHLNYSIERLQKEIAASDKPVVVDFGKDSCTACAELEEITFPNPKVQEALKNFTFIQIDLTANSEEDKALLKKYELFGTPNIIFFDKDNTYMPEKSLSGFISAEDFVSHLTQILQ
ncbi:MAG: thiol:disulfide interchange protein [Sulfurovum sp.]|nr:MAG: thiol:disulfide interchange protein [Sulfurovum sp.]RUM72169.1 MAG: thiol:disulfide interchange protein [Sulfurovum sp.]RUM74978.1 MAG: thiol:disulfide interchange protein [Sulfurovum sp.]